MEYRNSDAKSPHLEGLGIKHPSVLCIKLIPWCQGKWLQCNKVYVCMWASMWLYSSCRPDYAIFTITSSTLHASVASYTLNRFCTVNAINFSLSSFVSSKTTILQRSIRNCSEIPAEKIYLLWKEILTRLWGTRMKRFLCKLRRYNSWINILRWADMANYTLSISLYNIYTNHETCMMWWFPLCRLLSIYCQRNVPEFEL